MQQVIRGTVIESKCALEVCQNPLIIFAKNSITMFEMVLSKTLEIIPVNNFLFKINNRNTRKRCEICSKLKIKTPERRHTSFWCLHC